MRRGRHVRRGIRIGWVPVLLAFVAVLVLLLAGAAFAGYRYDRVTSSRILPGVTIAGVNVGGMTRGQAVRALEPLSRSILGRTVEVRVGARTWTLTPGELGTKVAVDRAVDQAMSVQSSFAWPARLYHRLLHKPVHRDVPLRVRHDGGAVWKFVHGVAEQMDRPAWDASLDFVDGQIQIVRSRFGASVKEGPARKALMRALRKDDASVEIQVTRVAPLVTEDDLGMTIVIRTALNKLFLYDGVHLMKTYDVATGQPKYPTPLGHFTIVNKRINPTWYNPALDTWGKDEPEIIPPGPDNPLGTRALDLSVSGIRIHGTHDDESIGHAASHGCIRMHIPDSEDLFDRVDIGTPVIIAL